jgi:hypothetical protein
VLGSLIGFNSSLARCVVELGIAVLAWHELVEHHQAVPTHRALNLMQGFSFSNQDAHRLAIRRITALQLPQGERWCVPRAY